MPRPVCVKCQCEMKITASGAVTFNALVVRGPYQQWQGDRYQCPACGAEIITAYGDRPSWEHFEGPDTFDNNEIAISYERKPRGP